MPEGREYLYCKGCIRQRTPHLVTKDRDDSSIWLRTCLECGLVRAIRVDRPSEGRPIAKEVALYQSWENFTAELLNLADETEDDFEQGKLVSKRLYKRIRKLYEQSMNTRSLYFRQGRFLEGEED